MRLYKIIEVVTLREITLRADTYAQALMQGCNHFGVNARMHIFVIG
jgi:hypothetical protein